MITSQRHKHRFGGAVIFRIYKLTNCNRRAFYDKNTRAQAHQSANCPKLRLVIKSSKVLRAKKFTKYSIINNESYDGR